MELDMIVEEYEMVDIINSYLNKPTNKPIILGGIIGTSLFEHVFNACMSTVPYDKICIIEGIQDIIGMRKLNDNHWNHYFYAELFTNRYMQNTRDRSSFESFVKERPPYVKTPLLMTERIMNAFDLFIINDAHLIPDSYLSQLKDLRKKMFILVDPFEIGGERYFNVPTIVDSLKRLPTLVARARALYDVETRAYDKTQSTFETGKASKRSIGKLGDRMYVSNDPDIIRYARNKQHVAVSKKNHRMMVMDEHVIRSIAKQHSSVHACVTKYSLIQAIQYSKASKLYTFRIYGSTNEIMATMSYDMDDPTARIHVIPANILTPDLIRHHRFKHLIFAPGDVDVSVREMYTIMKCTKNLLIVE